MNIIKLCRDGHFMYSTNDAYIGKSLDLYGEYSKKEREIIYHSLHENDFVVEVGANIGALTIPIAHKAGKVIAFEPQRIAFNALCGNVFLNSLQNVFCYQKAVGKINSTILVPDINYDKPNNFGNVSLIGASKGQPTEIITLDSLNLPKCNLLKADVEGMELEVLQGAQKTIEKFHPILYVESDRPEKRLQLVDYIEKLGYQCWQHMPPLFDEDNAFKNKVNVFGNTVSINLLCLHAKSRVKIDHYKEFELTSISQE